MFKELSAAINCEGCIPMLSNLLAPIVRACELFDNAGNADATALCVCEAYFVTRQISLQVPVHLMCVEQALADTPSQMPSMLSTAISGAAPSKLVSKALK